MSNKYIIWNGTDNIPATAGVYTSKRQCLRVIEQLRDRFRGQGYYRDNNWNKIAPEDIQYEVKKINRGERVIDAEVRVFTEQRKRYESTRTDSNTAGTEPRIRGSNEQRCGR
jgi:hypothetical protein